MASVTPVDYSAAEGRPKELLDAVKAALGATPNMATAMLGDVIGHVALNVLTNYFNKAFDIDVDFPVVEPYLHAAAA